MPSPTSQKRGQEDSAKLSESELHFSESVNDEKDEDDEFNLDEVDDDDGETEKQGVSRNTEQNAPGDESQGDKNEAQTATSEPEAATNDEQKLTGEQEPTFAAPTIHQDLEELKAAHEPKSRQHLHDEESSNLKTLQEAESAERQGIQYRQCEREVLCDNEAKDREALSHEETTVFEESVRQPNETALKTMRQREERQDEHHTQLRGLGAEEEAARVDLVGAEAQQRKRIQDEQFASGDAEAKKKWKQRCEDDRLHATAGLYKAQQSEAKVRDRLEREEAACRRVVAQEQCKVHAENLKQEAENDEAWAKVEATRVRKTHEHNSAKHSTIKLSEREEHQRKALIAQELDDLDTIGAKFSIDERLLKSKRRRTATRDWLRDLAALEQEEDERRKADLDHTEADEATHIFSEGYAHRERSSALQLIREQLEVIDEDEALARTIHIAKLQHMEWSALHDGFHIEKRNLEEYERRVAIEMQQQRNIFTNVMCQEEQRVHQENFIAFLSSAVDAGLRSECKKRSRIEESWASSSWNIAIKSSWVPQLRVLTAEEQQRNLIADTFLIALAELVVSRNEDAVDAKVRQSKRERQERQESRGTEQQSAVFNQEKLFEDGADNIMVGTSTSAPSGTGTKVKELGGAVGTITRPSYTYQPVNTAESTVETAGDTQHSPLSYEVGLYHESGKSTRMKQSYGTRARVLTAEKTGELPEYVPICVAEEEDEEFQATKKNKQKWAESLVAERDRFVAESMEEKLATEREAYREAHSMHEALMVQWRTIVAAEATVPSDLLYAEEVEARTPLEHEEAVTSLSEFHEQSRRFHIYHREQVHWQKMWRWFSNHLEDVVIPLLTQRVQSELEEVAQREAFRQSIHARTGKELPAVSHECQSIAALAVATKLLSTAKNQDTQQTTKKGSNAVMLTKVKEDDLNDEEQQEQQQLRAVVASPRPPATFIQRKVAFSKALDTDDDEEEGSASEPLPKLSPSTFTTSGQLTTTATGSPVLFSGIPRLCSAGNSRLPSLGVSSTSQQQQEEGVILDTRRSSFYSSAVGTTPPNKPSFGAVGKAQHPSSAPSTTGAALRARVVGDGTPQLRSKALLACNGGRPGSVQHLSSLLCKFDALSPSVDTLGKPPLLTPSPPRNPRSNLPSNLSERRSKPRRIF